MSIESTATATTAGRFAEIERAEQSATPGPWEPGAVWIVAGLIYDADGNRVTQKTATHCSYCNHGEPEWVGRTDINGTVMKAHRHRDADPYQPDHRISGPAGGTIAGNYDYEAGGILSAEDTRFICAARSAVPELLAAVKRVEKLCDDMVVYCGSERVNVPPWVESVRAAMQGGEDQ